MSLARPARVVLAVASWSAGLLTVHAALNARVLRTPAAAPPPVTERVSLLLPVRDEIDNVDDCLTAVLASTGVPHLEVLVLDDDSHDGTGALARRRAEADGRVRVLTGKAIPPGWLGKPHALAQLTDVATGTVVVTLDADVRLAPHALAATVDLLRRHRLAFVSPYPRQVAVTAAERLVQPLLQWSWLTLLPLRVAERSRRPSLAAANGQLMALDRAALDAAGGFAAVRSAVLDDVALARAMKVAGGSGGMADGTQLATCRMYSSWGEVRAGYVKSLWSVSRSPSGSLALAAGLGIVYVLPALAASLGSAVGAAGYAAAVLGRAATAHRTGGRVWPDAAAHPASVLALIYLLLASWRGRRRGTLSWKGRPLP